MTAQPTPPGRARRKSHGLVAKHDGAGSLGTHDTGRGTIRIVLVITVFAGIFGALSWRRFIKVAKQPAPEPIGSMEETGANKGVTPAMDLRRSAAITAPLSSRQDQPDHILTGAEDLHLGEEVVQSRSIMTAPPGPPRASVDLEPVQIDDPRDFELPNR